MWRPLSRSGARGIARVVRRGRRRVFALEALEAGPGVDQGAVDREVLIGQQAPLLGLGAPHVGLRLDPVTAHARLLDQRCAPEHQQLGDLAQRTAWEREPDKTASVAHGIYLRLPADARLWLRRREFVDPDGVRLAAALVPV